ncbi:hypothetical protein M3Y97_00261200 [Aphelenchoides bicaudatus]|nr:hypothetical protein M3Y97_00261200 [Aphelenchoides bicaudatus]
MALPTDSEFSDMLKNVANGLVGLENRHLFVLDFANTLDKYVLPDHRPAVKRFLMTFLKQFSASKSRSVHFEILPLWLMLAKYSETMSTKQILDQVKYLYTDHLPYYQIYIAELLSAGQNQEAQSMLRQCIESCSLTSEQVANAFPMLQTPVEKTTAIPTDTLEKTLLSISRMETDENTLCSQTEELYLDGDVTVQKIADCYRQNGGFLGMLIGTLLGAQLAQQLSHIQAGHKLSPQSVVVSAPLEASLTPEVLVDKCILKVVESKTKHDYSTDTAKTAGFLNVIGYLLFLDSFDVVKTEDGNVPSKVISRRFVDRDLWVNVFYRLLNNNSNPTDWTALADELKAKFVEMASTKKMLWNSSVQEFNKNFLSAL